MRGAEPGEIVLSEEQFQTMSKRIQADALHIEMARRHLNRAENAWDSSYRDRGWWDEPGRWDEEPGDESERSGGKLDNRRWSDAGSGWRKLEGWTADPDAPPAQVKQKRPNKDETSGLVWYGENKDGARPSKWEALGKSEGFEEMKEKLNSGQWDRRPPTEDELLHRLLLEPDDVPGLRSPAASDVTSVAASRMGTSIGTMTPTAHVDDEDDTIMEMPCQAHHIEFQGLGPCYGPRTLDREGAVSLTLDQLRAIPKVQRMTWVTSMMAYYFAKINLHEDDTNYQKPPCHWCGEPAGDWCESCIDEYPGYGAAHALCKPCEQLIRHCRLCNNRRICLGRKFQNTKKSAWGDFYMCNNCKERLGRPKKCENCKVARYCDKKCQKEDWKDHKKICHLCTQYNPIPFCYRQRVKLSIRFDRKDGISLTPTIPHEITLEVASEVLMRTGQTEILCRIAAYYDVLANIKDAMKNTVGPKIVDDQADQLENANDEIMAAAASADVEQQVQRVRRPNTFNQDFRRLEAKLLEQQEQSSTNETLRDEQVAVAQYRSDIRREQRLQEIAANHTVVRGSVVDGKLVIEPKNGEGGQAVHDRYEAIEIPAAEANRQREEALEQRRRRSRSTC